MPEGPGSEYESIIAEHGPWTAMSIDLGGGRYTREPAPDLTLRRLVQVASDVLGTPLSGLRVLDLACLEGQYGIEFALQGADVVGIEIRAAHLAKARYAQQQLGLKNIRFIEGDVREIDRQDLGGFDVVICSGILYHLDVPDVFRFAARLRTICDRLLLVDTHVALNGRVTVMNDGNAYAGVWYQEHSPRDDAATKYHRLWASADNDRSFWFTHASLCNLLADVGFRTVLRVENPVGPEWRDRGTYAALPGHHVPVVSSPITEATPAGRHPERIRRLPDAVNLGPLGRLTSAVAGAIPERVRVVLRRARRSG